MANKVYLPNFPIVGEEGTWESISELVRRQILPKIEAVGDKLFQSALHPLPSNAAIVPIVSESWSRPRQDGTPQFVYLVSGQGLMFVEGKMLALNAGKGFYLPKGTLYAPYLMLGKQILSCEWLWFKIHPFGVVVLRSRLTQKAHYQSAHFIVAERRLADLFSEWERERGSN